MDIFKNMCGAGYSCPNIKHLLKNELINNSITKDPLKYYLELVIDLEALKSVKKEKCNKCLKKVLKNLNKIKEKLEQTNLIRDYLKLPSDIKIKPLELIYERLIVFEIIPDKEPSDNLIPTSTRPLLDSYIIGPYQISIYPPSEVSNEYLYQATPLLSECDFNLTVKQFQKYIDNLNYFSKNIDEYYPPEQLIEIRKKQAESFVKTNLSNSSPKTDKILIEYLSYQTTALKPLIPYLIDDQIEEIFIDNPYSRIYLDHRRLGRCITSQLLDKSGFDKLVTYLRATTGLRLDAKNPSLKTELLTSAFHIRISVDISPLAADGFHVDIRKLRRKYFSITELIANNTLTAEAAAYLYFCMTRKKSILVLGRPGDGKTTIINALDGLTPPFWRKITVEDVVESVSQTGVRHQTRVQVDPLERGNIRGRKAKKIVEVLHRCP
ncbi:MAG: ATPase, T2SS/T4P/T4SS family, partial [Candidatus Odinarchaeota archaeon]